MKCIQLSLAFGNKTNGALITAESHFLHKTVIKVIEACVRVCVVEVCVCVCVRARACVRTCVRACVWRLNNIKVPNLD